MGDAALKLPVEIPDEDIEQLKSIWDLTVTAYKDWMKVEDDTRKKREKSARAAVARCYTFAKKAFEDPEQFETLRKSLAVQPSVATVSRFYTRIRVCFGDMVDDITNPQEVKKVWKPISDQQAHKYAKIMDYATFQNVSADEMEEWLNKTETKEDTSLNKRYNEAVKSPEFREYCISLGYTVKDDNSAAKISISKEQKAVMDELVIEETALDPGSFSPGYSVILRHIDKTGYQRLIDMPLEVADIQKLIEATTKIDPSAKGVERLLEVLEVASIIKLRKNDAKGRVIALANSPKGTSAKIAHNHTKGSIMIELTYGTSDDKLPHLETYLPEKFIKSVKSFYKAFGGDWVSTSHNGAPAIQITPPANLSVDSRLTAVNEKRKGVAEKAAKKRAEKDNQTYVPDQATYEKLYIPDFMSQVDNGQHLIVPLTNLVKSDEVKFASLRDDVVFAPETVTLKPVKVEELIEKEDQMIKTRITNPNDSTKTIFRVQGELYSLRFTNSRISFCDMDGTVVRAFDMPDKIGTEGFHQEYIFAKRTLGTALSAFAKLAPDADVKFEFSPTVLRISVVGESGQGTMLLPAATTPYTGNTSAFAFE